MKLMRKLEKQAMARAAKEARKQQGKLVCFCVIENSTGMLSMVAVFDGQLVTSNWYKGVMYCIQSCGNTHAAFITIFIFLYIFTFVNRL